MITRHGRLVDDVGGVEAAAEPDLDDRRIGRMLGKQQEGHGGQDLEDGDRLAAIGLGDARDGFGQHLVVDQPAAARRGRAGSARASSPDAARCGRGRARPAASSSAREKAAAEPLPLVPAMWITGGSRSCGLPSRSSSRVMRSSDRSKPFGCSASRRSISRSAALVVIEHGHAPIWSARAIARRQPIAARGSACQALRPRFGRDDRRRQDFRLDAASARRHLQQDLQQPRDGRLQLQPRHDHVDHAVLHQIFGALEAFGQLFADGLLDDARAGKADQRAGLGDVHVAQHRVGGGDAAGGRVGQHDDVGQAGFLAAGRRRPWCAAAASATGCLPACARRPRRRTAPAAACFSSAVSKAVMIASPAAMPSEPPMKAKSCTVADDRQALDRAERRRRWRRPGRSWRWRP